MNIPKQNKKTLLFLFVIPISIILSIVLCGIFLGFLYSLLPGHHPQQNRQACESVGGDWSEEQNICLLSYKTAGEICTDGGQCISGACSPPALTDEQKINLLNNPLKNIIGTCYPENLVTGCVPQVLMGIVTKESMCLSN